MNFKAIEAALSSCITKPEGMSNHEWMCRARWRIDDHGDDILRLVRAMAWMEEQGPTVRDSRGVAAVEVYRDSRKETYFGPTIIDAIEAAMAATDQQTKGATDEA